MPLFNHSQAVSYAIKYAIKENPAYPPFPMDCTSFVSQAMYAGGWTMTGGSIFNRESDTAWWWGKSLFAQASYTWAAAENFSRFLAKSGRATRSTLKKLTPGDIVQIARPGGVMFHTMIVTDAACTANGDTLYLSYHTNNKLNNPIQNVFKAHSPDSHVYHYWKVAQEFKST